MWLASLSLQHDCIIGNRCKRFSVKSVGYPLESYVEGGFLHFLHFEKLVGEEKNVRRFIADLQKDSAVEHLEVNGSSVFFSYKTKQKKSMPSNIHLKKVIFVKPVVVDESGVERWEVASWDRDVLNKFIEQTKKDAPGLVLFKIEKIIQTPLSDLYFTSAMPSLSVEQNRALSLAIEFGYYGYPRSIELKDLAKKMGISLSTYREHLRRAEKKVMPLLM